YTTLFRSRLDPVGGEHGGGGVARAVVDDDGEIRRTGGLDAGRKADGAESAGTGDRHGCSWERWGAGTAGREAPARGGRGVRAALLRADGRGQGASAVRLSPVPSDIPRARFRDWIAAPAVPLTRLSSAEMTDRKSTRLNSS